MKNKKVLFKSKRWYITWFTESDWFFIHTTGYFVISLGYLEIEYHNFDDSKIEEALK